MKNSLTRDPPLLTAEEYLDLPDDGERGELVRGQVVREPPPSYGHGSVTGNVYFHLRRFVERHHAGRVVGEAGFVVARGPDTVRGPDVSFVSAARDAAHQGKRGFFEGAPDLAVEILSPANTWREMARKTADYFAAGAHRVWIVDPAKQTVVVHVPGRPPETLTAADRLDGGDLLPGLSLPVRRIFED
jgi:Uma2 family endonuclease